MTELYFIRHCESDHTNHDELSRGLTAKGQADTRLVTEYLRDKQIDAVLSSPFKRAVDTVKPFAESVGLTVIPVQGLQERRVDSEWIEDFDGFARRQWADFSYKRSDGESLGEVQARMRNALGKLLEQYEGRRIAIGSHGTALSVLVHTLRPSFGFEGFDRIRPLMPWAVHFSFDGKECVGVEETDLFSRKTRDIL